MDFFKHGRKNGDQKIEQHHVADQEVDGEEDGSHVVKVLHVNQIGRCALLSCFVGRPHVRAPEPKTFSELPTELVDDKHSCSSPYICQ